MPSTYKFKGGKLDNRYKLTATLTLKSPLHIGDGESTTDTVRLPKTKKMTDPPEFSTVMTDYHSRAYIPASTLKGKLRSWLAQIFTSLELAATNNSDREKQLRQHWDQCVKDNNTEKIYDTLKLSEYLFGSGLNEGKLEFQDALMISPLPDNAGNSQALAGYDAQRGTMILKNVAINPETGTAAKHKLYHYEAVPAGARFGLTVTGQNLSNTELGMLMFALEGFNSQIYPVTLGAMSGIGFGRAQVQWDSIYRLDKDNLNAWLKSAVASGHAGYAELAELPAQESQKCMDAFRSAFLEKIPSEEKA